MALPTKVRVEWSNPPPRSWLKFSGPLEATIVCEPTSGRARRRKVGPRARLTKSLRRLGDIPVLPTAAGHDAGILSARVPTAMLFVRNPTGVSHSPEEHAEMADCNQGAVALADIMADWTSR